MQIIDPSIDRLNCIPDLKSFYDFAHNISVENLSTPMVMNEFKKLAHNSFMTDLILYELNHINSSSFYNPVGANYTSINLIDTKNYVIDLTVIDSNSIYIDSKSVTSLKQDHLLLSLTDGEIQYSLYRQNNEINPSILDESKKLTVVSEKAMLAYGECLALKGHKDIFRYKDFPEDKKIILLNFTAKQPTTFIWSYNIKTLLPEKLIATVQDSRIENMCVLLGNFHYPEAVVRMKEMLMHPKHNIRWTAFKTLITLDFEEGCKSINSLSDDPHPEIRTAVIETKELIHAQLVS